MKICRRSWDKKPAGRKRQVITKRLKQKIQNKKVKKNVGQYYIDRIYGLR